MSTIIKAKRSSVQGKVPLTTDLELGEFAINTFDGKLYTKKNVNGTESIVDLSLGTTNLGYSANSSAVTITSDTGSDIDVLAANNTAAGVLTATAQTIGGNKTFTGDILFDAVGGNEGGEIKLAASPTGGTLAGAVSIDIYQNRLRIFENGGSNRGIYIDLTSASGGVGTNLLATSGATSITTSANGSSVTVISDTGNDGVILAANSTSAGVLTAEAQTISGTKTFSDTINGSLSGNASTATALQTARIISLGGDLSGSASFDGTANVTITATIVADSVTLGTDTTGNYVASITNGSYITGGNGGSEGAALTLAVDAATAATASKVVARDASGNFSANTITAALSGNATTATTLQTARTITLSGDVGGSASFNGSADVTITTTVQPNSVELGTDTTGNYVANVTGGTGVTITGTAGEGWTPTIAIGQAVGTTSDVEFRNLVLSGNLTINGTTTTVSATELVVEDNLIYLNANSTVTNPDIGIVGNYNDGTYAHTGVFRDATDGRWKFFKGYVPEPGQTIDTANNTFQYADVQANTFYGALSGNATTATTLATGRTISLTGDVTYTSGSFDGSGNVTGTATLANSGVTANTYGSSTAIPVITVDAKGRITSATTSAITVGNGTLTLGVSGVGLSGSQTFTANQGTNATFTVTSNATNANTPSTIVSRDASGNFSAGTITAELNGNAATVTNGALTTGTLAQFASTTSAQLASIISDETGTGTLVFGTSPTFTTGINAASTTMALFDTTATTVNAFGATTTLNLGYDSTAASTTNISTGAVAASTIKTINIATGGAASSVTNINMGSSAGGNTIISSPSLIVPGNMSLGANILATTGPILTLGALSAGGTGYMNGTHTNQGLTGGTGAYMLGTVTVALGVVTGVTLTWGGNRYSVGDVLTVPSLTTTLATTATTGDGTTATITFAAQAAAPFQVGSQIIVAGVTPTGYNGTFTVTACTTTSVSYANATTGAQTVAGTVKMGAALTNSTIPVATVQGTDLYISSYTSDSIGARIRLEANDTSTVAGQEYGAITFGGRDASARGSGDLALIRAVGVDTSGGGEIQFWTAGNGEAPNISATVTSGGNFRLYNSTGTFYSELSNSPTANRTLTIPDVAGTVSIIQSAATAGYFDTSATTPTGTTRLNYGGYFYPTALNLIGQGDTATAATNYFVETGSDGFVRPKTLANVRTEIVTTAAVNAAAATTVGTVTSGTWNATAISDTYIGTISTAGKVSNSATTATSANTANAIVARDGAGDFSANVMTGTATRARYADLAEKYLADKEYPVGTVMSVGGELEITASTIENSHSIAGVVSNKPAYLMNNELEGGTIIALRGRVPVLVTGVVNKGDRLTASRKPGYAIADNNATRSFAIALHDSNETELVEAIIL